MTERTRPALKFVPALASRAGLLCACLALSAAGSAVQAQTADRSSLRIGDRIAAIVNQELVTAGEVDRRVERAQADASRSGQRLPPPDELRELALNALIDERAIISTARDQGMKVEEIELDRAVQSIAAQNQITLDTLRDRLKAEGLDYARFRANLRDQIMVERLREREVYGRIKINDEDIDKLLEEQRAQARQESEINLAQILVSLPEGVSPDVLAQRQQRAQQALDRVLAGAPFETVALEISEDANRDKGGEIGLRAPAKLPDAFVEAARALKVGEVRPTLLRTGSGFHVIKLLAREESSIGRITETRARHVLLRTSPELSAELASRRLAEYKRDIENKTRNFEDVARQHSEDGTATRGGDLGWFGPGAMVPEFETAMNGLPPGGISDPVISRFGVHLIQVLERRDVAVEPKQLREQARNVLREQRFEQAYQDWTKELRARAYIEMREQLN